MAALSQLPVYTTTKLLNFLLKRQADWSEVHEFLFYRLWYRVAHAAGVKSFFVQRRKEQKPGIGKLLRENGVTT